MAFLLTCILLVLSGFAHADQDSDFIAAREAYRTGQIQLLPDYAQRLQNSVLLPYIQYWQLTSRIQTASGSEIRDFIASHSDSPLSSKLLTDWLRQLGLAQDWSTFLDQYPLAINPDTSLQCYHLQARIAQGQAHALTDSVAYWFTDKTLPSNCDTVFDNLVAQHYLSQDDIWQRVRLALASNNTSLAVAVMAYLPDKISLDPHQLLTAENSPEKFLATDKPMHQHAEQELVLYAINRLAWHDAVVAAQQWRYWQKFFPAAEQQRIWGQIAVAASRQHLAQSLTWFEQASNTALNDDALAWKARAGLLAGNWRSVQISILSMSEASRSEPTWQYWLARADKAQGDIYQANLLLLPLSRQYNFYGLLAEEELGAVAANVSINFTVSSAEISAIKQIPAIQRALLLYQMDLRIDAYREWNWASRQFNDRQLLAAAELAHQQQWLDCAINTANRTEQLHNFDLRFLAPYRDTAHQYAQTYGLDEAWIYGLMRQESRFVCQARSGVGASGLMQIMPATARWIATKLGIQHFQPAQLNTIATSLQFGIFYLKTIQQSLDNSEVLATAAYNAGPRRAQHWRTDKAMEGAIYIETIPFSETRNYVKQVMANTIFYARRFNQPETSIKTRLGVIAAAPNAPNCSGINERAPGCDDPN